VPANDLLSFYTTCICSEAEYACPVFHTALPQYFSDQLERLQKRALPIIRINDLSYRPALEVFNIPTLYDRREAIGNLMFQEISNNNHILYPLLPPPYLGTLRTRKNRKFQVPRFKTNRFRQFYCKPLPMARPFHNSYILNDLFLNNFSGMLIVF